MIRITCFGFAFLLPRLFEVDFWFQFGSEIKSLLLDGFFILILVLWVRETLFPCFQVFSLVFCLLKFVVEAFFPINYTYCLLWKPFFPTVLQSTFIWLVRREVFKFSWEGNNGVFRGIESYGPLFAFMFPGLQFWRFFLLLLFFF